MRVSEASIYDDRQHVKLSACVCMHPKMKPSALKTLGFFVRLCPHVSATIRVDLSHELSHGTLYGSNLWR